MKGETLPSIRDMYNCTRQNFDYNVIRASEGAHKNLALNVKPTKKSHYLEESIKLNCSPGPANHSNHQSVWFTKSTFQCKRAERQTYLDLICKKEKKGKFPSPNHYDVSLPWPKKITELKSNDQKTNFADNCQYQSDKIPGPGAYNLRTIISKQKNDKKYEEHKPLKGKEVIAAEIGTYSPCPLQYNTFARYTLLKNESTQIIPKISPKKNIKSKENVSPGPCAYSTISYWMGKPSPKNKNENNFFQQLSKAPSHGVYH